MSYPTRFVYGEKIAHVETRHLELKEVKGSNPRGSIINSADQYAVAFLNAAGGRIFWGISDSDKQVVGVKLAPTDRDLLCRDVNSKLRSIRPQIDPTRFELNIHPIQGAPEDFCVIELVVPASESDEPFFTTGDECFVRLDGTSQRLSGPQLAAWIKRRRPTQPHHDVNPAALALAQRVRRVITGHGLQPSHLARLFKCRSAPFSITLADQQDDATFLRWLDEAKIDWIARTFGVRREWIDGEDQRIFEEQSYDRDPAQFLSVVSNHADTLIFNEVRASPDAWFIRHGIGNEWGASGNGRVIVIIRVPLVRFSNEVTIYRYLSDFEPYQWDEGRGAVQLRAWARLLAVTKGIHCWGREVSREVGDLIWSNSVFLHEILSDPACVLRRHPEWHPEDCALYPEESVVAAPDEFFPSVINFLRTHRLPHEKTRLGGPRVPPHGTTSS